MSTKKNGLERNAKRIGVSRAWMAHLAIARLCRTHDMGGHGYVKRIGRALGKGFEAARLMSREMDPR